MNFKNEKDFLLRKMHEAMVRFCSAPPREVSAKAAFDLVTETDMTVEKYITDAIKFAYPGDTVIGEETKPKGRLGERTWVIDPIDGTYNMARGIGLYGIQCAFCVDGEPVVAAIFFPDNDTKVWAVKGEGVFMAGKPIAPAQEKALADSVISFGDYSHKFPRWASRQHEAVKKLYAKTGKIRMFGAASYDFVALAKGSTDAMVMLTANLWDLLPGALICSEAGAEVLNVQGEPYKPGDFGIIAGRGEALEALKNAFAR